MICIQHQDYYVFEPAKLINGSVIIPERWYTHKTGTIKGQELGICPWCLMDLVQGNHWRLWSQGHCVLTFMMWWYYNNTSDNLSKKWNKHNSFIFTAAGLPHVMAQKESNLECILLQWSKEAQENGIWAWDVEAKEMVLVIPVILAMLDDNPMQSSDNSMDSQASASEGSGDVRTHGDNHSLYHEESIDQLKSMFKDVTSEEAKSHYQKMKTESGLKDYLLMRGNVLRNNILHAEDFISPIWHIKGFVKYFWWDAISRLNDMQKTVL
ncbi:hypothetical protein F5I97DRAFT_1833534 [Phlebopus sp. FC_14]|nr:hypothetical protein F5I97DRAFT_1833534 [Phlebopus sp. FC_14]